jgi:hypothetical protein
MMNDAKEKPCNSSEVLDPHEEIADESEFTGKASPFVYVLVICVCVGGFLFGYDTGGKQHDKIFFQRKKKKRKIEKKYFCHTHLF